MAKVSRLQGIIIGIRKNAQIVCGLGVGLTFGVMYLPEGLFCHRLQRFHQIYQDGLPVDLPQHNTDLCQTVLDDILLPADVEVDVHCFPCVHADPIHRGSCKTRGGSLVGLPANFRYRNREDIMADRAKLLVGGNHLDWSKDASQRFLTSLLLSESAKKFVIAREIKYCDTWSVLNKPLLLSATCLLSYTLGHFFNEMYSLRTRISLRGRLVLYAIWTAVGLTVYTLLKDSYLCYLDNFADRTTAQLGPDYAQGGIDFYEKLLERNCALRELLADGDRYYTLYGNQVATWRQKQVPIRQRSDNLRTELAKLSTENENSTHNSMNKADKECKHCK